MDRSSGISNFRGEWIYYGISGRKLINFRCRLALLLRSWRK